MKNKILATLLATLLIIGILPQRANASSALLYSNFDMVNETSSSAVVEFYATDAYIFSFKVTGSTQLSQLSFYLPEHLSSGYSTVFYDELENSECKLYKWDPEERDEDTMVSPSVNERIYDGDFSAINSHGDLNEIVFDIDRDIDAGFYYLYVTFDADRVDEGDYYVELTGSTSGSFVRDSMINFLNAPPDVGLGTISYTSNSVLFDSEEGYFFRGDIGNINHQKEEYKALLYVSESVTFEDIIFTTFYTGEGHSRGYGYGRASVDIPENLTIEVLRHTSLTGTETVGTYPAKLYNSPANDPFPSSDYDQLVGATGVGLTLDRGMYVVRVAPNSAFPALASIKSEKDAPLVHYDQEEFDLAITGSGYGVYAIADGETDISAEFYIEAVLAGKSPFDILTDASDLLGQQIDLEKERRAAAEEAARIAAEQKAEAEKNAYINLPITLVVNGMKVHTPAPPVIVDGSTLAPVRQIAEALGLVVTWDADDKRVDMYNPIYNDMLQMRMWIGDPYAEVNTNLSYGIMTDTLVSVPPQIIGGSTMVPVRFLAETMGFTVTWDADTKTVTIDGGLG